MIRVANKKAFHQEGVYHGSLSAEFVVARCNRKWTQPYHF